MFVLLYWLGLMDLILSFCVWKYGCEKVEYLDLCVEFVLKEIYGIMVY